METGIKDIYYLEKIEQLEAISDPIRYRMCLMMAEPRTGAQLAHALGISRARAHYHLNILKDIGLVSFCGEGMSHGITEKYYQAVAKYFDFSKLIPKDEQSMQLDEVTLRSFRAAVRFIANLLDMSREGISHLKVQEGLGIGFHYILNTCLTPLQFRSLRDELAALKNRIIQMQREAEDSRQESDLVHCRITLFLTPVSEDLEAEVSAGNERTGDRT
ncbi:MAG: ArsR/SmtB family transcription factor [Anaerolineae bacterium]